MATSVQIKRYDGSAWQDINPKTIASLVTYGNSTVADTLSSLDSGKQTKVSAMGSTSKPVYISAAGTFSEASTYAGGTAVTLNGSSKGSSTASFYAPTAGGTSGYYLKGAGTTTAPTWQAPGSVTSGDSNLVTGGNVYTAIQNAISSTYKAAGSKTPSEITAYTQTGLNELTIGSVYNVSGEFTTTSLFLEGQGNSYPAGTNVVVVKPDTSDNLSFDVLAGFVDLSSYATQTWVNDKGYTTNTGTITGVSINGTSVATSGVANITSVPWSIISSKPTIPATNVIPAQTTANKLLLSTTTSGTAAWSSWSSAGFLKTNASGVVSVDTSTYLTSHQSVTSDNSTAGWGATVVVGKVGSTELKFTMPANPNTNTTYTAGCGLELSSTNFRVAIPLTSTAPTSNISTGSIYFATV